MNHMLDNYRTLVTRVDELCHGIEDILKEQITCSAGCSGCCCTISIFPVEAAALNLALNKLPEKDALAIRDHVLKHVSDERCPLLKEQRCLLYDARPIICRTHGLPILYTEDNQKKVDCCPNNLEESASLSGSAVIDLDRLNPLLVAINALFVSQSNPTAALPERMTIAEAIVVNRTSIT